MSMNAHFPHAPKACWCLVDHDGNVTSAFDTREKAAVFLAESMRAGHHRRIQQYIPAERRSR